MRRPNLTVSVVVLVAVLAAGGCAKRGSADEGAGRAGPASLAAVAGQPGVHRIHLTADAAHRIGLATAVISSAADGQLTVPTTAVLYDEHGRTWVWMQAGPLSYQRAPVGVLRIQGATAVLISGPSAGTRVVTVGVAELRGVEEGVPGEQ